MTSVKSISLDSFYHMLLFFSFLCFSKFLFSLLNVLQFFHVTNISASSCETESYGRFLRYIKHYNKTFKICTACQTW